ncbi:nicotinate-nucleotide adenylyltransferase [Pediococcus argentinicus]|uniref:Probable nicotinate-nucleotide adenylyltransferase n=1 Tax=Pediococcus argentinicus TaxID=480391 RepID=A0A0R2NNC9_9LACO|nr:nicotinate-nucleotide adenylyltransferase [Pediococcus argentinicus]KRO25363.1 nicotinate (nicotinamide) nucleotide adenylyltransferase [Pediococcus argentinicus]NKZ22281.1 nicotinate-nucleotide adenylyltransferase [Pediococcus argentinicus]GEP19354.1 putative nicotinate-nucleotide adenylyltransferase [Pediococcus argentinicus]
MTTRVVSNLKTTTIADVEVVEQPLKDKKRKKVGIMGGTFNPPHLAHLVMAEQVRDQLGLDEVLFIPDYLPPHVDEKHPIRAENRIEMVKLAIEDNPGFKLDLREFERKGKSYSFDTVSELVQQHPENEYYFIIGSDMVDYLPKWYRIDDLVRLVQFVGVRRGTQMEYSKYPVIWVDAPQLDISSTLIRTKVNRKQSIKYLVPSKVADYIKEHHLYER